ncbi:hypothetical protein D3C76_776450 [compost metagenome]
MEARVVHTELGVVQRLGRISESQTVLAAVTGFFVLEALDEACGVVVAALVDEVGAGEVAANAENLGFLPFVLVVGLHVESLGQGELTEHLANRQQDLFDFDAWRGRFGGVHRALCGRDARVEQAFTPVHYLITGTYVQAMPADVPGAIDVRIEHAQVVAVLVDGVLGEAIRARAETTGEAVGSAGVVIVALVVHAVVEARGAQEYTVVGTPVEVGLGDETGTVVDHAAFVEGVVAVVAVGIGDQLVIAVFGTPGGAVGQGGVPVDLQVFARLKAHRAGVAAQPPGHQQHGQTYASVKWLWGDCCFYHVVLMPRSGQPDLQFRVGK